MDGLLDAFGSGEGSLSDLEDRLQATMDNIDNLNSSLTKVRSMDTRPIGSRQSCSARLTELSGFSSCRPKTS